MKLVPKNIYINAAKLVANDREKFACRAITSASAQLGFDFVQPQVVRMKSKFEDIFCPEVLFILDSAGVSWYGDTRLEDNQMARSLALLFMAEMATDDNR